MTARVRVTNLGDCPVAADAARCIAAPPSADAPAPEQRSAAQVAVELFGPTLHTAPAPTQDRVEPVGAPTTLVPPGESVEFELDAERGLVLAERE